MYATRAQVPHPPPAEAEPSRRASFVATRTAGPLAFMLASGAAITIAGGSPLATLAIVAAPLALGRWPRLRWLAVYVAAWAAFVLLRSYADTHGLPVRWEYALVWDEWLGAGVLPTIRMQARWGGLPYVDWPAAWLYITLFYIPPLAAAFLALADSGLRRYVLAVAVACGVGAVVHWLLPTVPPWLAAQYGADMEVQRLFLTTLYGTAPELLDRALEVADNPVAAMPSMHMALTALVCLAAWHAHRYLRAPAVLYGLAMLWCIVYLGEHYVVDGLAGLALAFVAWRSAEHWLASRRIAP